MTLPTASPCRFALYFFLFLLSPVTVMACDCPKSTAQSAAAAYEDADIVVEAKIIQTSRGWDNTGGLVRLQVIRIFKGRDVPERLTVNYNNAPSTCGLDLPTGETGIFGLYDTRNIALTNAQNRGYGFRMLISCAQDNIRAYLQDQDKASDTIKSDPALTK